MNSSGITQFAASARETRTPELGSSEKQAGSDQKFGDALTQSMAASRHPAEEAKTRETGEKMDHRQDSKEWRLTKNDNSADLGGKIDHAQKLKEWRSGKTGVLAKSGGKISQEQDSKGVETGKTDELAAQNENTGRVQDANKLKTGKNEIGEHGKKIDQAQSQSRHARASEKEAATGSSEKQKGSDAESTSGDSSSSSSQDEKKQSHLDQEPLPLVFSSLALVVPPPPITPVPATTTTTTSAAITIDVDGAGNSGKNGAGSWAGAVPVSKTAQGLDTTGTLADPAKLSVSQSPQEALAGLTALSDKQQPAGTGTLADALTPASAAETKSANKVQGQILPEGVSSGQKIEDLTPIAAQLATASPSQDETKDGTVKKSAQEKAIFIQRTIPALPQAAGTPAATSSKSMSIEDKQKEFAARDKQLLPEVSVLSKELEKIDTKSDPNSISKDTVAKSILASLNNSAGTADLQAVSTGSEAKTSPSAKMANLTALISNEVSVMHQFKPDKLEVVLRPDSQTQIFLQLNMREGKIDGTARCEHGDFSLLSSHWADLQRTMEGQGVRLAPLRESNSGSYSGQNSFHDGAHSQQQQQERNPGQFGTAESSWTPAAPAPKVSLETAVLEKTNSDQLLQMWV